MKLVQHDINTPSYHINKRRHLRHIRQQVLVLWWYSKNVGVQQKRKQQGLLWEEASYTTLLNIHSLKQQINQGCLLRATDITEEISSFGGTINSSLQQLYTGLSLGRTASLIPSTSQAYLICQSSSCNTEKCSTFNPKPYTHHCRLRFLKVWMRWANMRYDRNQYSSRFVTQVQHIWCGNIMSNSKCKHIQSNWIHNPQE